MTNLVRKQGTRYASYRRDLYNDNRGWSQRAKGDPLLELPGGSSLRTRLNTAILLLDLLDKQQRTLNEGDAEWVRELWETLDEIEKSVPELECWCVVKEYHPADETSSWFGRTTVWIGCLTKSQAEDMRSAIEEHYRRKDGRDFGDKWVVERRECRIRDVLKTEITAERYVRSLG